MADQGRAQAPIPAAPQQNQAPAEPRERRSKRRKRPNKYLPKRPKKAASAYSMFLRNYYRNLARNPVDAAPMGPRERLREASAAWRMTTPQQRADLAFECTQDQARYNEQMDMWKRQKQFLKRPASAYALFLKDNWATQRAGLGPGDQITLVGRRISDLWNQLPQEQKNEYKARYALLLAAHKDKIANLRAGRRIPELEEERPGVNRQPVPAQPNANAFDDDEEEDEPDMGDGDDEDDEE